MNNSANIHQISHPGIQDNADNKSNLNETYDIKLSLSRDEISSILDSCLSRKIEHAGDDIEKYLDIAECIKSSNLSEEFCRYFSSELSQLLVQLVGHESDSYEVTNFQHRMLRKFEHYKPAKNIA